MGKDSEKEILDLPEKKRKPGRFDTFIILFLAVILLGILFRIMHLPYSNPAIIIGSIGLTATYALRFFLSPKQSLFQLLQIAFGALLVAAIVLDLTGIGFGYRLTRAAMWLLIPIIILGIYSYFFKHD
jgi:hypothetical protein